MLAISAHWYIPGTAVTAMNSPPTIHDFYGFPPQLHQFRYPAPGNPALGNRVQALLAPTPVALDQQWGLDHGVWSVLCHVFPKAGIPVVQLSMDERQPPRFHYELGKRLAPLRDEGVFIMASGNVVHNLRARSNKPWDWAIRFEDRVREAVAAGDHQSLMLYEKLDRDAMQAVPTPEHFLPLLYAIGLQRKGDPVSFPTKGIVFGGTSMLTVKIG